MTFAVAFDASPLANAALERASTLASATDTHLVAAACVPDRPVRAREKGWIGPDEEYDIETVVDNVRRSATDVAPAAEFRCEVVGGGAPRGAVRGALRDLVTDIDPSMLFVGSERAGTAATPMDSVAGTLVAAGDYDVCLVRGETRDG